MKPILTVLQLSESFEAIWTGIATEADCEVVICSADAEVISSNCCGLIISAAGAAAEAEVTLSSLCSSVGFPIAIVCDEPDHRLAVRFMARGASSYFALPQDLNALRSWTRGTADHNRSIRKAQDFARSRQHELGFESLIGSSAALRSALSTAQQILPHASVPVLILGETGTGKELLAQAIHYNGPRAAAPMLTVNCAALPAALLEAELFGYERGAFTDAREAKPGIFEAAEGGTVFLDEIGEFPVELQAKLLRAIESRTMRRIGALADKAADIRFIAATNVDLRSAMAAGRFRPDLFFRFSTIQIRLPALRERGADVFEIADHLLKQLAARYGVPRPRITPSAERLFTGHTWPGNVRELRNGLERAVLLGKSIITEEDFDTDGNPPSSGMNVPATLASIQLDAARTTLDYYNGNKSAAAHALSISRKRLYAILRGADLDQNEEDVS